MFSVGCGFYTYSALQTFIFRWIHSMADILMSAPIQRIIRTLFERRNVMRMAAIFFFFLWQISEEFLSRNFCQISASLHISSCLRRTVTSESASRVDAVRPPRQTRPSMLEVRISAGAAISYKEAVPVGLREESALSLRATETTCCRG